MTDTTKSVPTKRYALLRAAFGFATLPSRPDHRALTALLPRHESRHSVDRRVRLEDVVGGSELVFPVRRLAPDGLRRGSTSLSAGTRATS
jgi:hypothetical protein